MNRTAQTLAAAVILLLVGAAAYWLWPRAPIEAPPPPAAVADAGPVAPPAPDAAASALGAASAADAPAPLAPAPAEPPLPADDGAVQQALIALLGKPAVLGLLQTDGFAQRVVATVDNLPRAHAAPRLWPVVPMGGRFTVNAQQQIALDNAERYGPFVRLVESVAPADAAALYRRLAPQLQSAYEDLGYPGQRFQARLVEVIDHLLATPPVAPLVAVALTDVKGPIPSERPWVRYEFADPALEARSAGQKILLRVGEVNQRRLMAWLRQFRAQIAR